MAEFAPLFRPNSGGPTKNLMIRALLIIFIIAFPCELALSQQTSGAAHVYRTQFLELRGKVAIILDKASPVNASRLSPKDKQDLEEELFALTKLAHRLGEESERSDVENLKRGQSPDKTLLLIAQGCDLLAFVLTALRNFVDTNDLSFWVLARDGETLVGSIQKLL